MNKITSQNYQTILGRVAIDKVVYASKDHLSGIEQKIKLMNGEALNIPVLDLAYRVQIIQKLPDGAFKVEYEIMPRCLFSQALVNDKICYIKDCKKYKLNWMPLCHADPTTIKNSPQDEEAAQSFSKSDPIPNGSFRVMKNNTFYALSSQTKIVYLNQVGTFPLHFASLKLIYCDTAKAISPLYQNEDEFGFILAFDFYGKSRVEILLDGNHLYTTMQSSHDRPDDSTPLHYFFHITICSGEDPIDKSKITAWLEEERSVLWIKIPFTTQADPSADTSSEAERVGTINPNHLIL